MDGYAEFRSQRGLLKVDDFLDHLIELGEMIDKPDDYDLIESMLSQSTYQHTGPLKR